jgi:acetylornithine deacetylase/succinyl-diaminopimelate desuccinylase-like protein
MINNLIQRTLDQAIRIQQIAAPTFNESARAEFVRSCFADEGLSDVSIDDAGNVFARLPGRSDRLPLIVSAHLDTVFPAETNLTIRRDEKMLHAPGIGDNSLGVAALFALLWSLRDQQINLPGDVWLVANSCEEGLGDLKGMRAVVDRFGSSALAYLVIEGMALGNVYHQGIGVRRYKIICRTRGGHSWIDYGQPSAIHELAGLITRLTALAIPSQPRTSLNVGKITGGTSINTLASESSLELDLRSEGTRSLEQLIDQVESLVSNMNRPGVRFDSVMIGNRPAGEIDPDHRLIRLAENCLNAVGIDPALTSGSTDANVPLSKGYPALVLGLTTGGGAHTLEEYIDIPPLEQGIEQLVSFVVKAWG